ncbi:unnamed protein product [Caenorhabditis angaria]|uniref:Insulin-like domain-containing protein n=1 Tax=Caenorhabditis angaria TaxID=860376 RepID=A0A9P1IPT4_9PELO|nr:unnamed protein product [Caenorhabditis angaria]
MCWFQKLYSLPILASTLLILILLSSQPTQSEATSMRLCGSRLVQTLQAVCRNQICSGMSAFKRSPFYRSRESAATWAPATHELFRMHHENKRGGIATECCENRCTMTYLKTYCCPEGDLMN